MNKHITPATSVAMRVATAMYQMGIDGLPRNYELVYEAYSGANPELTREFVALGKTKSQRALDELGRKYLPHHHEEALVARTSEKMRLQMNSFMNLLEEEKTSLSDYGRIIGEATRTFAEDGEVDQERLSLSIRQLGEATERQVSKSQAMVAVAAEQAASMDGIRNEAESFERMKFLDPLTGLANRRSFNKAVARVYANPELPMLCGLAFAEIDGFAQVCEADERSSGERFIRQVGHLLQAAARKGDLIARLDGDRYAFLINSADETEIMRTVDLYRAAASGKPLIHAKTGRNLGKPTLSVGIAMSSVATGAAELMEYCEKALNISSETGNWVTFYSHMEHDNRKQSGWMIYRP